MAANGNPQTDDAPEIEVADVESALPAIVRAEIDIQIATAKRYPRSITKFKREAEEQATLDADTAGSMFYVLRRKDRSAPGGVKIIEGPSVRLAEIVGSAWGNVRYDSRVIDITDKHVVAQGTCLDLEKNIAARIEVRRRITTSEGRRYGDDMIAVTANAACSIALRQSIFKVVPFAHIKDIFEKAKEVSLGKGLSMDQRRSRAFEWFSKVGATQEEILKFLGRNGPDDITVDDLVTLQGTKTAIQEGETTWAVLREEFNASAQDKPRTLDALNEKLKGKPKTDEPKTEGNGDAAAHTKTETKAEAKADEQPPAQEQETKPAGESKPKGTRLF